MMSYDEAVAYIEEIPKFTEKHTLSHTREFLRRLGSPEKGKEIIHVAGTNGKGSVCAYIQAILMAEGRRVGFFTSPHLISINERIRVDNCQISDELFLLIFTEVKEIVDGMYAEGIAHPSYFEFLFGMGMKAFALKDVDYIILETGLGGRLDATNAISKPAVTVITSISLDHTRYLGHTISEIAGEKAGIIKSHVPVICDAGNEEALMVIRRKAREMGSDCREISKNAFEIREITDKHIAFSRVNAYDKCVTWKLTGCGTYQMMNASLAIAAAEELLKNSKIHYEKWQKALSLLTWEGRMEEILPGVFVDGAHNPGAVEAFVESVQALTEAGDGEELPVILFSAVEDKEYEQMIAYLTKNMDAAAYVVTEIEDKRKVPAKVLAEVFERHTSRDVMAEPDIEKAVKKALKLKGKRGRLYCLGSLYLVGEIKKIAGQWYKTI